MRLFRALLIVSGAGCARSPVQRGRTGRPSHWPVAARRARATHPCRRSALALAGWWCRRPACADGAAEGTAANHEPPLPLGCARKKAVFPQHAAAHKGVSPPSCGLRSAIAVAKDCPSHDAAVVRAPVPRDPEPCARPWRGSGARAAPLRMWRPAGACGLGRPLLARRGGHVCDGGAQYWRGATSGGSWRSWTSRRGSRDRQ